MKKSTDSAWYQKTWLPFAAATYILICLFDFIIMPVYVTAHNSRIENAVFARLEDDKSAAAFADGLVKTNQAARQWNPLTLLGGGMFHLAFGALLTGGAVTRGIAKKSEVEGYYRSGAGGYGYDEDPNAGMYGQSRSSYGGYGGGGYRNQPRQQPVSTATDKPMPKTTDLDDDTQ